MRSVQVASQIQKFIHADNHQHENAPRSQEKQRTAKNCDTRVRRCNECIRAPREHPMHTYAEVDDQQHDVKVSCTSARVIRYVIRVRSRLARERCVDRTSDRSQIESRLVLAAGEGTPTPESWGERSVVVRKRPHDDRREARGKTWQVSLRSRV